MRKLLRQSTIDDLKLRPLDGSTSTTEKEWAVIDHESWPANGTLSFTKILEMFRKSMIQDLKSYKIIVNINL